METLTLVVLKSYFITGTDTDVGKTVVTAGLARACADKGIDVGIMKPFAAGKRQTKGFSSQDTEILSKAARVSDPESLVNPQFFPLPASPYTASINLGQNVDLPNVFRCYKTLSDKHGVMIVEGMGGIMTPILKNYFVADLISEMNLDSIIITRTKIGTVNHTIMTAKICKQYNISVKGIIINNFDKEGYPSLELKRDLENLTGLNVLAIIPRLADLSIENVSNTIKKELDISSL